MFTGFSCSTLAVLPGTSPVKWRGFCLVELDKETPVWHWLCHSTVDKMADYWFGGTYASKAETSKAESTANKAVSMFGDTRPRRRYKTQESRRV